MRAKLVGTAIVALALGGACGRGKHGGAPDAGSLPGVDASCPPGTGGAAGAAGAAPGGASGQGGQAGQSMSCAPPAPDLPAGLVCESGDCWINPRPTGNDWETVQGSSPSNVWVGGFDGNVLHFDGTRWGLVPTGMPSVNSVWSFSPADVWIVGSQVVEHGDGTTFAIVPFPPGQQTTGSQAWGAAPNDLYIAGIPLFHWDGSSLTTVPEVPTAFFVTGSGSNDVWAGDRTNLFHFDGTAWSTAQSPPVTFVVQIASAGPGRLWALGFEEGATHVFLFDGMAWSETLVVPATRLVVPTSIAAGPAGQAMFVGDTFDPVAAVDRAFAEWWNGTAWTEIDLSSRLGNLTAAWIDATGAGYAVGEDGAVLHVAATGTLDHVVTQGRATNLTGVWAASLTDAWVVGASGESFHYDGCKLTSIATGITTPLRDVWGANSESLWAVGDGGVILHGDGATWTSVPSGTTADLLAVWTAGANQDVWVGGHHSTLMRITPAGAIVPVPIPGADPTVENVVTDIHGSGPADVWIATGLGGPGAILHNDGTNFIPPPGLPGADAGAAVARVWAYSATDVWVSFSSGPRAHPFYRFDGTAWQPQDAPFPPEANLFLGLGPFVSGAINNSFALDPAHDFWVLDVGKFLRTQ